MSTQEVRFLPSYDYREDPNNDAGACGMRIHFILRPSNVSALTFEVLTGWMAAPLAEVFNWSRPKPWRRETKVGVDFGSEVTVNPIAGAVTLHSATRNHDWWVGPDPCDVLEAGNCFGNYGFLVGDAVLSALVREGSDGLWREMKEIHDSWMEDR